MLAGAGLEPRHEVKWQQGLPGTRAVINGVQSPGTGPVRDPRELPQTDPRMVLRSGLGKLREPEEDWKAPSTCYSPKVFLKERAFVKLEQKHT